MLKNFSNSPLVPDGCAFKLASALSGVYAGTGQAAEMKLHAVYSVRAGTAVSVTSTAGSVHDSDGFWPERWEKEALYIWDLAFNSHERFLDATLAGAHVLQRLKESANPTVLASYGPTGTRRELHADDGRPMRLDDACAFGLVHHQTVLDLDVQISDGRGRTTQARVVCVPHNGEDRYYLTTLSRDIFTPHDVAELYRLRWEVELFFRNWKGGVRLDHVRFLSHPWSLQLAVTASLLAALMLSGIHAGLARIAQSAAEPIAQDAAEPAAITP